ncbi:MAG: hypothetical protein ACE5R6_11035 [Candidatus Heimdallarchaeota archaeon]
MAGPRAESWPGRCLSGLWGAVQGAHRWESGRADGLSGGDLPAGSSLFESGPRPAGTRPTDDRFRVCDLGLSGSH